MGGSEKSAYSYFSAEKKNALSEPINENQLKGTETILKKRKLTKNIKTNLNKPWQIQKKLKNPKNESVLRK